MLLGVQVRPSDRAHFAELVEQLRQGGFTFNELSAQARSVFEKFIA